MELQVSWLPLRYKLAIDYFFIRKSKKKKKTHVVSPKHETAIVVMYHL